MGAKTYTADVEVTWDKDVTDADTHQGGDTRDEDTLPEEELARILAEEQAREVNPGE